MAASDHRVKRPFTHCKIDLKDKKRKSRNKDGVINC